MWWDRMCPSMYQDRNCYLKYSKQAYSSDGMIYQFHGAIGEGFIAISFLQPWMALILKEMAAQYVYSSGVGISRSTIMKLQTAKSDDNIHKHLRESLHACQSSANVKWGGGRWGCPIKPFWTVDTCHVTASDVITLHDIAIFILECNLSKVQ